MVGLLAIAAIVALPLTHIRVNPSPEIERWWTLGLLCLGITLGQLARVPIRVGANTIELGWGEAALIVAAALAPTALVPLLVAIGVALKHLIVWLSGDPRTAARMVYNVGALTLAATAAVVVAAKLTHLFGLPTSGPMRDEANVLALVSGALVYTLVAVALVAAETHAQAGSGFSRVAMQALRGKLLMLLGNVAVGLLVVFIICVDPWWLLGMPPIAWMLQHSYAQRARAYEESRMWRDFAEATKLLHQPDDRGVAEAGVRGARTMFGAVWAELHVRRSAGDGGDTCYVVDASGDLTIYPSIPAGDRSCLGDLPEDPTQRPTQPVRQALAAADATIGELWLGLPLPTRLGPRELLALAAFADNLTASLHDASTERELRALTARNTHAAWHDQLTGLPNRTALVDRGTVRPTDGPIALIMLDLDRFRAVNDTLGHSAGDEVLRIVANRLHALTRPGELAARLSGDEFAVLITGIPPAPGETVSAYALNRAREVVQRLAEPVQVAGVHLVVEAAAGVVVAVAGEIDMTELLRRADIAMYQAKEGHEAVVAYDGAQDAASTDRLALLAELREALAAGDQLEPLAQPIVTFADGSIVEVEVLIRWRHPRRGLLLPHQFIPVVEQSDVVGLFTNHVVDLALTAAASWAQEGQPVRVSVNLPARCLHDRDLPGRVADLLTRHGVPAKHLLLEITETVMLADVGVVDVVLADLRAQGVELAVDDFGSGFSSLTFLTRVPVNEVKIDKAFVDQLAESVEAAAIVRTTVALCRELGMRVVAEGVETAEQRSVLAALGCTTGQGYLFYPPMPADRVAAVLAETRRNEPPEHLHRVESA